MTTTYTATFSNGQTVTRTTERTYATAGAYVNKITGALQNVSFSATAPKPNGWGIFFAISRRCPYADRIAAEKANAEAAKIWTWEIVPAQPAA